MCFRLSLAYHPLQKRFNHPQATDKEWSGSPILHQSVLGALFGLPNELSTTTFVHIFLVKFFYHVTIEFKGER